MSVSCECYVLCGRGLFDGTSPRPAETCRVCVLETSTVRQPRPEWGCCATGIKKKKSAPFALQFTKCLLCTQNVFMGFHTILRAKTIIFLHNIDNAMCFL